MTTGDDRFLNRTGEARCRTPDGGKRSRRGSLGGFAALVALGFTSCDAVQSTLSRSPPESQLVLATDYAQNQPVEIAVLPVRRPLDFGEAEGNELRSEIYSQLLEKNYTPLDPDYVAKALPQPFAAEGLPEMNQLSAAVAADAYVMVELHKAALENQGTSRPRYRLDGKVWLRASGSGAELYSHDLVQAYDVALDGSGRLSGAERREKLKLFAARLLTGLPLRRTR